MKKSLPESSKLEQNSRNFRPRCWNAEFRGLGEDLGLDFGGLGKVLGAPRSVLGPAQDVSGPNSGSKVFTQRQPHSPSKKALKKGSRKLGSAARGLRVWGPRKTANFEKSIAKVLQTIEENANPANMA